MPVLEQAPVADEAEWREEQAVTACLFGLDALLEFVLAHRVDASPLEILDLRRLALLVLLRTKASTAGETDNQSD
jgi:hypothetical protein